MINLLWRLRVAVVLSSLIAWSAVAQSRSVKTAQRSKDRISVQVKLSQDKVPAGSTCYALLLLSIQNGWHINSATPADENLIGTSEEFGKKKGIEILDVHYPGGTEKKLDFAEEPLEVYEGRAQILLKILVTRDATPATYTIPVTVHYQACDDKVCLAPASVEVRLPLRVVSSATKAAPMNEDLFDAYEEVRKKQGKL
jgi:thioredoxin:protein disulfide reductase